MSINGKSIQQILSEDEMKYVLKYPREARVSITPRPDIEVEPGVLFVDCFYECDFCHQLCTYKIHVTDDEPGVYCCSEECKTGLNARLDNPDLPIS